MTTRSGFQRILFAVDETDATRVAVPLVAALARCWAADLHLLHVRMSPTETAADAEALVTGLVDALDEYGIAAGCQVRVIHEESVGAAIARAARRQEADLVVVGSHGRTGLGALFEKSTSHAAAAELSMPVLVARVSPGLHPRPLRVLAAIDTFPTAKLALTDAVRVARPTSATVRVLHVQDPGDGASRFTLEADDDAHLAIERGLAIVRGSGLHADREIVLAGGSVGKAIAAAARRFDADLVVVASRRPSDLAAYLGGSVTYELIHDLDRPVLLAHRG